MLPVSRTIFPDLVRDQTLVTLTSLAMVAEAAKLMAKRHMGAVLVVDRDRLVGIVTERDIAVRVWSPPGATRRPRSWRPS